jgi:hypothetical protein
MNPTRSSAKDPFEYHVARVLILVVAFSPTSRSKLDGLTKIAKLDFLLRYPVYLERLMDTRDSPLPPELRPSLNERQGLESSMIRYKYGPWDDRYYPVIGRLIGQGLAVPVAGKGAVALRATAAGKQVASNLAADNWSVVYERARILKAHLDLSGSTLKQLIYESFPEVIERPWRTSIDEVLA